MSKLIPLQALYEQSIYSGELGSLTDSSELKLLNSSGAIVSVLGTWDGTIVFEGTNDDFVTVQPAAVFTPSLGAIFSGVTINGYYRFIAVAGFTKIRARFSIYNSGTAYIILSASLGTALAPIISVNHDHVLVKSKLTDGTTNVGVTALNELKVKDNVGFSTGVNTRPSVNAISSIIIPANSARKYAYIINNTTTTVSIKLGTGAVNGQTIVLGVGDMFEIKSDNLWLGDVSAVKGAGVAILLDVFEGS